MVDETAIIKKAQDGDLNAFSELISSYKKLIYNLCLRMMNDKTEAEDATQEAFIKIYRGLKSYNGTSKFSTWAMKISSNVCIDIIRKRKVQTVPIEDYEVNDDSSPEKAFLELETRKDVERAVQSLPEKYRIMIVYYHFMNLSYQEISNILNEPMTIVKNRLYRARLMLKEYLLKEEGGYNGLQNSI